jgi:hypothetical protein
VIAIGFVVALLIGRVALRRRWPGIARVAAAWQAHRPAVLGFMRGSPATFTYLAILSMTTWVLVGASPKVAAALLEDQSTNLHHLARDPVRVLIRSAFWLSGYDLLFWAALFLVVLAPAERWLGTSRWLVAFAGGHIGATLLTSLGIWLAIRSGAAPARLENVVDVGVSYGFGAVAALFTYRLAPRWRGVWAAGLVAYATSGILIDRDFTAYGHAAAVLIGFALYPLTRAPEVRARATQPLILAATQPIPPRV